MPVHERPVLMTNPLQTGLCRAVGSPWLPAPFILYQYCKGIWALAPLTSVAEAKLGSTGVFSSGVSVPYRLPSEWRGRRQEDWSGWFYRSSQALSETVVTASFHCNTYIQALSYCQIPAFESLFLTAGLFFPFPTTSHHSALSWKIQTLSAAPHVPSTCS